ncbi:MAG: EAL domain-containing protein [Acidobacteriota bacterium]
MDRKERTTNLYLWMLLPAGVGAMLWAGWGIRLESFNRGLIGLAFVTIFLSSYLRIQLPRTKIHLTISDALIFLSLLMYGGQVAVIIAVLETSFASWNLRRQGVSMRPKTVVINILITAISVFVTWAAVFLTFGSTDISTLASNNNSFIWMLAVMALAQFCVNSLCVSAFVAIKSESTLWRVWNEYCLNALAMYLCGAVVAGICAKAVQQINMLLFAAMMTFFAIVYITYRRYAQDVKETAAKAEDAERQRAEQAEAHVQELRHYVGELERSGEALRESREKFKHAAYHDALTGLPNRNFFVETLRKLIKKSSNGSGSKFAVLFLDLNRFKTINDSLGHSFGDAVIKQVADRLYELISADDQVGRFSGDEFAIILNDASNTDIVTQFAEKVAKHIAEPFMIQDRYIFVGVSIGIAFDNSKYAEVEEILRDADIAMYYAKENQKNYVIFDQKMHMRAVKLLELETDLRYAIERDELELYYQPIVSLDSLTLSGFEALVRWNHPTRGLVPPDEFIALSEDTGLIVPMTVKLLNQACRTLAEWQKGPSRHERLTMSVNISGKHFSEGDLVAQIKTVLAETAIDPVDLKLEVTESAVMENAEQAILTLKQIRETGVHISIDDFGTGYSSLSYLHRFPIDVLKIDRSFVSTMEDGSENGEIVRTVIALAKTLNLNVVAEGIESIHQLHQLRILGCEFGQGYLFSRPLPAQEIRRLLDDNNRWQGIAPQASLAVFPRDGDYTHLPFAQ